MQYIKLGNICSKIGSGSTPKGGSSVYIDKGISLIRSQNVYNLFFLYKGLAHITEKDAHKLRNVTVNKNDILMNITGDSIARTCMVPDNVLPARVNQHVVIIRPDANIMNPFYLNYYLASPFMQETMLNLAVGKGSSRNAMTKDMIEKFLIPCPSISIQSKIVTILRSYDTLIENNNKRIKILEQMAENLYKEWFVRFRFPGYEKVKYLNNIPVNWKIKHMDEFCYVTDGTHNSPKPVYNNGIPLVTGSCIKNGFIDFTLSYNISQKAHESISKRSGLKSGDILYSNIGTVGNTCLVDYDREFSVKNVIIFKPDSQQVSYYLYYWLNSSSIKSTFSTQTNGSSQQFIGLNFMRKYKILIPDNQILNLFASRINPLRQQMLILHKKNELLCKQRDLLLPRLMSGKLKV